MTNIILQISRAVCDVYSYFPLWTITAPKSASTTRVIFKRKEFDNRSISIFVFYSYHCWKSTPHTYEDEKGTMMHLKFQFNELGMFAELKPYWITTVKLKFYSL